MDSFAYAVIQTKMKNIIATGFWISIMIFAACKKPNHDGQNKYGLKPNSIIEWKGTMDHGFNNGSFNISENNIKVKNQKVTGGSFVFPIASIRNFNLPDSLKDQFLHHLKSADFFNMALYPEASFTITAIRPYEGGFSDAFTDANYLVEGDFKMLGKTNRIVFAAVINVTGNTVALEAKWKVDRTRWGMNYATDPEGTLYIHKDVELYFKLMAERK